MQVSVAFDSPSDCLTRPFRRRPSPRATLRHRYAAKPATRSPSSVESSQWESRALVSSDVGDGYGHQARPQITPTPTGRLYSQYLGEMSSMLEDVPILPAGHSQTTEFSQAVNQEILKISQATAPIPDMILHACADAYFQYAFHRVPVLDQADVYVDPPPIMLCQALCMLGSTLSRRPTSLAEGEKYYFKAKTLVHMDFEQDPITTLKVICFLTMWNITGPVVLTSDCSWHWIGRATRLLQQLGLNREAVCASQSQPGTTRRLAWFIFVSVCCLASREDL